MTSLTQNLGLKSIQYDKEFTRRERNNVNVKTTITEFNKQNKLKLRQKRLKFDCATDLRARHTLQAAFNSYKIRKASKFRLFLESCEDSESESELRSSMEVDSSDESDLGDWHDHNLSLRAENIILKQELDKAMGFKAIAYEELFELRQYKKAVQARIAIALPMVRDIKELN
tara:strand:+ start:82 stop:597 length:516 start_codon:yes stop_codon:yes gene_type:complete